jgi:riboflavin synthase
MFTGLIADLGDVTALNEDGEGATLEITTRLAGELGEGDSIAVNGVCLSASEVRSGSFVAQAMRETLERSALGALQVGARASWGRSASRALRGC